MRLRQLPHAGGHGNPHEVRFRLQQLANAPQQLAQQGQQQPGQGQVGQQAQPPAQQAQPQQQAQPAAGQQPLALPPPPPPAQHAQQPGPPQLVHHPQHQHVMGHARREATNEYAALFVALIGVPSHPPPAASTSLCTARTQNSDVGDGSFVQCGLMTRLLHCAGESDSPQGVVNTSDGRVVRAFHRFTLVDQSAQGRDLMKGRSRAQGAVKISCARQVPHCLSHKMASTSYSLNHSLNTLHCLTSALQGRTCWGF